MGGIILSRQGMQGKRLTIMPVVPRTRERVGQCSRWFFPSLTLNLTLNPLPNLNLAPTPSLLPHLERESRESSAHLTLPAAYLLLTLRRSLLYFAARTFSLIGATTRRKRAKK